MERLQDRIGRWIAEGKPIGFSPWRDAKAVLWGIPLRCDGKSLLVDEISPLGQRDGENVYRLSSISYFQEAVEYSERLVRLGNFQPTQPEEGTYVRDRSSIKQMLIEACASGEVLRARLRDYGDPWTVSVGWVESDWIELARYDDLMALDETFVWRISCVEALRWRTAYEEADEYLRACIRA